MKLPFVEALETTSLHEVRAVTPHLRVERELTPEPAGSLRDRAYKMRTRAIFSIDQWAEEERALPHLRDQAARALMHEVYGPVEDRLHEILIMLYEAGPFYEDKILIAVDQLLKDLKP